MVESKITEEKLVNTKSYRDKAISRVDVLDKVKDLFLIPEYNAPSDFISVLTIPTKTDIRDSHNKNIKKIEKLFTYIIK